MWIRILLINCCLLISSYFLVAQPTIIKPINTIQFSGLKKMKRDFLEQFIQSKVNELPSSAIIQADLQRLKNIVGIGNATFHLDTLGQQLNLVFDITEVRTLLPIVNFGGIKGNVWFQFGFYDANWKGRGQFLSASYRNNDQRHSADIFYRIPNINQSDWGLSVSLNTWASTEPLFFPGVTVNYDYDIASIGGTAIRRLNLKHQLEAGATFFIEKYKKSEEQFSEITPGPDALTEPKILAKWEYKADFLNYHLFYLNGLTWRTTLQNVYNLKDGYWFHNLQLQGRYFKRVGQLGNVAMRLRLGIATNNDTPFAPYVLDSHVNLRGVGNRIDRGTAQAIFNLEYRQTIQQSPNWGMQVVAFSDLGTWRDPGGTLGDLFQSHQFRHFLGGGFRLIYQKIYGAVLRVDYGIDVYNPQQRGLVIGFGQYF